MPADSSGAISSKPASVIVGLDVVFGVAGAVVLLAMLVSARLNIADQPVGAAA
ncbi:hypothetical protein AB0M46_45005 [Dactylosporangium sp. NPDC051485]|uniref:hypothetical protein n=1 Tax=Dactylosporangium sp. NPDC051485 TaxID=3154846 RepID=UPI00341AF483